MRKVQYRRASVAINVRQPYACPLYPTIDHQSQSHSASVASTTCSKNWRPNLTWQKYLSYFRTCCWCHFFELFMVQFLSDQSSCQSSTKKLDVELILPSSFSWSKTCGLSLQKLLFVQKASNPEDGVLQALKATNYLGSFQKSCSCPIWIDNDGFSYT